MLDNNDNDGGSEHSTSSRAQDMSQAPDTYVSLFHSIYLLIDIYLFIM